MTTTELTVEQCLEELREIFPTGYIEIAQGINRNGERYFAFEGCSKERWTPKRSGVTLQDLMAQVRKWYSEQRESER